MSDAADRSAALLSRYRNTRQTWNEEFTAMKKFLILRNSDKDRRGTFSKKVGDYLTDRGADCVYSADGMDIDEDVECVIVLGGDGTMLRAAKKVVDRGIPLMGINLGTLGYLAEVDRRDVYMALDHLLDDEYVIEERMMLKGTVYHNADVVASDIALNDVVIVRQGRLRVVSFMNYVNGEYLNSYSADGIILSTATVLAAPTCFLPTENRF